MSRDTDCIVAFENDQTRTLTAAGWHLDIIDVSIWQRPIDGWIASRRYAVRGNSWQPWGGE